MVDRVSETLRCPWAEVWALPVQEFLNIYAYRKDRDAAEKAALDDWKAKH